MVEIVTVYEGQRPKPLGYIFNIHVKATTALMSKSIDGALPNHS